MKESVTQILYTVGEVLAVMLVIAAIWMFLSKGNTMGKNQLTKMDSIQNNFELASYGAYDGAEVNGGDVISAIRMNAGRKVGNTNLIFTIKVDSKEYKANVAAAAGDYDNIEVTAKYKSVLQLDVTSGLVKGMTFTKQP